jgi:hypothetical protein
MKKHFAVVVVLGVFGMLAAGACSVGVGIGGAGCDACSDALAAGTDGDFCSDQDEGDYDALQTCACDEPGACAGVCPAFCTDNGDDGPDCDDCLTANCPMEYNDCSSDDG